MACTATKYESCTVDKRKIVIHEGKTYNKGARIATVHASPHCSMFIAMEANEFLRAVMEKRIEAYRAEHPTAQAVDDALDRAAKA